MHQTHMNEERDNMDGHMLLRMNHILRAVLLSLFILSEIKEKWGDQELSSVPSKEEK